MLAQALPHFHRADRRITGESQVSEDYSSYDGCLSAAGAMVHEFERFGSYQGQWIADVTLPDGRRGFIVGYYGSCSGCDAFEAELGYDFHACDGAKEYSYEKVEGCTQCAAFTEKKRKFGEAYFSDLKDREATLAGLQEDSRWNSEAREIIAWVNAR